MSIYIYIYILHTHASVYAYMYIFLHTPLEAKRAEAADVSLRTLRQLGLKSLGLHAAALVAHALTPCFSRASCYYFFFFHDYRPASLKPISGNGMCCEAQVIGSVLVWCVLPDLSTSADQTSSLNEDNLTLQVCRRQ